MRLLLMERLWRSWKAPRADVPGQPPGSGRLLRRYGIALAAVGAALLLSLLFKPLFDTSPFLLFWAAIVVSVWYGNFGPALIATLLTMLAINYFFQHPYYNLGMNRDDLIQLALFAVLASAIGWLDLRRRRAEALARKQSEWFHTTLASIGDAVIVTDLQGRIVFINPVASALTGWPVEAALGQDIQTVFHIVAERTRLPVENPALRALREGLITGLANHTLLISREGTERAIDDSGAPVRNLAGTMVGAVLVFRDVTAQKQAQEVLAVSEERLRAFQELSLDGFTVLESVRDETGAIVDFRWVFVNPAAGRLLHVSPETLLGQRLLEILPGNKEQSELFKRYVQVVDSGQPHDIELFYQSEGIEGWFRNMAVKLGDGVAVSFTNISSRRAIEDALRDSDERFRLATEALQGLLYDWDVAANVIQRSPGAFDLVGYHPDDMPGDPNWWHSQVHPDDLPAIDQLYAQSTAGQSPVMTSEYRVRHRDGHYVWVRDHTRLVYDGSGQPSRIVGYAISIDAHKQLEEALRASEQTAQRRLAENEAIYNTAPVGLCVFDADLRYARVNEQLAQMNGLAAHQIIGRTPREAVPALADQIELPLRQVLMTGEPLLNLELRGETAAQPGVTRTWVESLVPIKDQEQQVIGLNVVVEEVTERRRAEETIRAQADLLEQARDAIFTWEFGSGRIKSWYPGAALLYGWQPEEAVGRLAHELLFSRPSTPWPEIEALLQESGQWRGEIDHTGKDGQRMTVESQLALMEYPSGARLVLEVNRDVTERKRAEQALRRSEARTALLQELTAGLAAVVTFEQIANVIVEKAVTAFGAARGTVALVADDGKFIRIINAEDIPVDGADYFPNTPLTASTPLTDAIRSGHAVWIASRDEYRQHYPHVSPVPLARPDSEAVVALPLLLGDRVQGGILFEFRQAQPFGGEERALFLAMAQQCALALERAQLYEQVQRLAVLQERERLARDLHDAVSQTLFSANLIAEALPRQLKNSPEKMLGRLEQLRQLTRGAQAEMRTLLLELRPAALVEASLTTLLPQLAEAVQSRKRIAIHVKVEEPDALPTDVKVSLYRITQEALNNIAKHSYATQASIHLQAADGRIVLTIQDNGRGFDPARVAATSLGLGIMRERAAAIGAGLDIATEPGSGTTVRVTWPPADQST